MARKFAVSLNERDNEESTWITGIDESGMLPAHVLKEALRAHFGTTREVKSRATSDDVVAGLSMTIEAINAGFAMLAARLDRISVAPAPHQDTPELPPTMEDKPVEWETIDPEVPTPFLRGIKKVARPGMRFHD